jgi:hypothetical protein
VARDLKFKMIVSVICNNINFIRTQKSKKSLPLN